MLLNSIHGARVAAVQHFEFRKVVELTGVAPNLVRRWLDAGIILPAVGGQGSGSRNLFGLRQLVLVKLCGRLHRLGLGEVELRVVVQQANLSWDTWSPTTQRELAKTILWIRMSPHAADRYDARLAALASYPSINHSAPRVGFRNHIEVAGEMLQGEFGIAVNVADIIADLEAKTGDKLT